MARWLERLQEYDYEIQHRPGKQHSNAPSCFPHTELQIATVTSKVPSVQHQSGEEDLWSPKNVAQAQAQDPDIGPGVDQVPRGWKKPTAEELQPLSRAPREEQQGLT